MVLQLRYCWLVTVIKVLITFNCWILEKLEMLMLLKVNISNILTNYLFKGFEKLTLLKINALHL